VAFMFLGLIFIVGRVYVQRNLSGPGETFHYLNVPELGVIPNITSLPVRSRAMRSPLISIGLNSERDGTAISTWEHPLLAESYRGAVTSLMGANKSDVAPQVIVATSPNRQDGKSTTVSHFGIALAEMGKKVVLVDADLRKPSLHEMLDAPNNWGLSSILGEKTVLADMPLEYLVRPTHVPALSIITSGPGTANVSQLLYSRRVEELILRLRKDFDIILIDVPPIFGVADARIVGRRADVGVLILRAGRCSVRPPAPGSSCMRQD
jgi:succinoglycan biosynthesis transport protein ExoP